MPLENLLDRAVLLGLRLDGGWGCRGGVGSGQVVLIDNGRVYQSKAADALVQVKTTKFGTNVGLNMLLNISSRYFGVLFWSRQLRGLPSSDGYFFQKHITPCTVVITSLLVRNKPLGAPASVKRVLCCAVGFCSRKLTTMIMMLEKECGCHPLLSLIPSGSGTRILQDKVIIRITRSIPLLLMSW